MFTYGAGSTALLAKWILTDRRVVLHLLRLVPKVLRLLRQQMSEASVKAVPSDLRRLERFGYIYGPIAYLRSAFVDRWDRSSGNEPATSTALHEDLLALSSKAQLPIVSPHLDDAVFSCSGVIKGAHNPVVHTLFAGDAPADQPLSQWDQDCGFSDGANVMEQRRNEERTAASRLRASATWDQHLQEGYRPGELDHVAVARALSRTIEDIDPAVVLFPLGL